MINIKVPINSNISDIYWGELYKQFNITGIYSIKIITKSQIFEINGFFLKEFLDKKPKYLDYKIIVNINNAENNLDYLVKHYNLKKIDTEIYMHIIYINNKEYILEKSTKTNTNLILEFFIPKINKNIKINKMNIIIQSYHNFIKNMYLYNHDLCEIYNDINVETYNKKISKNNLDYTLISNKINTLVDDIKLFISTDELSDVNINMNGIHNYYNKLNKMFYLYIQKKLKVT